MIKKPNLKRHAAVILTSVAVVGIFLTTAAAIYAGMQTERKILALGKLPDDPKERIMIYVKEVWKYYVVVTLGLLGSSAAAIASHKISAKDIARLATLATGSGAAFSKYRGKIKELLGEEKEKEIFEKVKVEGPGMCYPRIVDQNDERYNDLYVHYILDFGVDEIPPIEFDSNPQRVTAAFYCINRDFVLGRIIDVSLVKDYLGVKYEDIDHKYFWIDTLFFESGMQPWIEFDEREIDEPGKGKVHIITVDVEPVDNKTLEKIESGDYWDEWRSKWMESC